MCSLPEVCHSWFIPMESTRRLRSIKYATLHSSFFSKQYFILPKHSSFAFPQLPYWIRCRTVHICVYWYVCSLVVKSFNEGSAFALLLSRTNLFDWTSLCIVSTSDSFMWQGTKGWSKYYHLADHSEESLSKCLIKCIHVNMFIRH